MKDPQLSEISGQLLSLWLINFFLDELNCQPLGHFQFWLTDKQVSDRSFE